MTMPVAVEDNGDNSRWAHILDSGIEMVQADWAQLSLEKDKIPFLTTSSTSSKDPSCQMFRMRGFVQDMLETEYCLAKSNHDKTSESPPSPAGIDFHHENLIERTPLMIAPIPSTTHWFRELLLPINQGTGDVEDLRETKRQRKDDNIRLDSDPRHEPVLANFYYDQYAPEHSDQRLRLNQVVDIVGYLEQKDDDPSQTVSQSFLEDDREAVPDNTPRLNVLWYQALDLDEISLHGANSFTTDASMMNSDVGITSLVELLSRALAIPKEHGHTTALAIMLTLLSAAEREISNDSSSSCFIPIQTPQETTIGCSSLNLVLPDAASCALLQSRLEQVCGHIVPVVQSLNITNETLKDIIALPQKSCDGFLVRSPLQLPKGSTLILNISSLEAGHLSSEQSERLIALQQLASTHRLPYSFDGGVTIPFEADIQIIVLSTKLTSKLIPCTLKTACNPLVDMTGGVCQAELMTGFHALRSRLAIARSSSAPQSRHCNIKLPNDILEQAQQDFIQRRAMARQTENKEEMPDEQDFHRWLTICRLFARSRQSESHRIEAAKVEDWKNALELDDNMCASIPE